MAVSNSRDSLASDTPPLARVAVVPRMQSPCHTADAWSCKHDPAGSVVAPAGAVVAPAAAVVVPVATDCADGGSGDSLPGKNRSLGVVGPVVPAAAVVAPDGDSGDSSP